MESVASPLPTDALTPAERQQLLAESDDPRVKRLELSSLRARAVENGD